MSGDQNNEGENSNATTETVMDYKPHPWDVLKATTLNKRNTGQTLRAEKRKANEALKAANNALTDDAIERTFEGERLTVDEQHLDNIEQLRIKCNIVSEEIEVLEMMTSKLTTELLPASQKSVGEEREVISQNADTVSGVLDALALSNLRNIDLDSGFLDGLMTTEKVLSAKSPDMSAVDSVHSSISYVADLMEDRQTRLGDATDNYDDARAQHQSALETVRNQIVAEKQKIQETALGSFNETSGRLEQAMTTLGEERKEKVLSELGDWIAVHSAPWLSPFQRVWESSKAAFRAAAEQWKADTPVQQYADGLMLSREINARNIAAGAQKPKDFS